MNRTALSTTRVTRGARCLLAATILALATALVGGMSHSPSAAHSIWDKGTTAAAGVANGSALQFGRNL
ncbi:MAG TPA: hypothetical protein VKX16_19555 [Chloroflexota bacterium]|nr:hypothetical protein [Chloroflexota bacterium]